MSGHAQLLHIGDAAERVGLSIRTLRHWEDVGLVTPTARSKGGFRLYSDTDVERLLVVKAMKPIGLSLQEMAELLAFVEAARHRSEHPDRDLVELTAGLERFALRTEERVRRIVRDMGDATTLLENINAAIRLCRDYERESMTGTTAPRRTRPPRAAA